MGVAAAVLWVSLGVLRGDGDDDWARRGAPALAWTGESVFVYGGEPVPPESERVSTVEPLSDAALIDPESGEVDVLADPPFGRPLRTQAAALAVGDEVLLVGQTCRESDNDRQPCRAGSYRAAVYSSADDEWREVDLPESVAAIGNGQSEAVGVTSDGRAVLLLGGRGGFGALANREIWTYAPADDEWEALPAPGSLIEGACLAGDAVVVGSGLLAQSADEAPPAGRRGGTGARRDDRQGAGPTLRIMALNGATRVWFPTEPAGVVPTGDRAGMTCGETRVLVDDGGGTMRVFELGAGGGWSTPAPPPGDDVHASRLWTGEEFLFLDSNSPTLAYDPGADAWRGIERSAPTGERSVWTGTAVIGWPGRTDLPVHFEVDG